MKHSTVSFVNIFWKTRGELLAFQECNGVDSLLACLDIAAILRFQSGDLNDIKRNTCITLTDGTIVLVPGLESSLNNLVKVLKRKRDEINKQAQRIQSVTSMLPDSNGISIPTKGWSESFDISDLVVSRHALSIWREKSRNKNFSAASPI